jgi:hypothetical protein
MDGCVRRTTRAAAGDIVAMIRRYGTERVVGLTLSGSSMPQLMIRRGRMRNISSAKVGIISYPPVSRIAPSPRIAIPRAFRNDSVS